MNETIFDRGYVKPIALGMASNCSLEAHFISLTKSKDLNDILDPYVHRVDSSELRKELPPMQQVVVHVRQTSLQSKLYRAYKRSLKTGSNHRKNFFVQFASLRPVHNHPVRFSRAPFVQAIRTSPLTFVLCFTIPTTLREVCCLHSLQVQVYRGQRRSQ